MRLKIILDHNAKLVTIWLTNAEQADATLREEVRAQYVDYLAQRYRIVEYCSGERELLNLTEGLLLHNRITAARQD